MAKVRIPLSLCLREETSPDLCMICGLHPSDRDRTETYNATHCTPLAILGFFFFSIFGLIVAYFLLRKQQPVRLKQCAHCASRRGKLRLLLGMNWVICLAAFFGGFSMMCTANSQSKVLGYLGLVVFLASMLYPILFWAVYSRRFNVSCSGINDRYLWLSLPNAHYHHEWRVDCTAAESGPLQMTCQHCRTMIPSDANFCLRCGRGV